MLLLLFQESVLELVKQASQNTCWLWFIIIMVEVIDIQIVGVFGMSLLIRDFIFVHGLIAVVTSQKG